MTVADVLKVQEVREGRLSFSIVGDERIFTVEGDDIYSYSGWNTPGLKLTPRILLLEAKILPLWG